MPVPAAELIARAIQDAGAGVVTNVPGFGGSQVLGAISRAGAKDHPISFHEEVAYTIAHGASLLGARSVTLIKAHGLAKAANSVIDSFSSGTTAGFVVLVFNDKLGRHSDSIFDVAAFLKGLGIQAEAPPIGDIYHAVLRAFARSEMRQLPEVLLIDGGDLRQPGDYEPIKVGATSRPYRRDVAQHLLCPLLSDFRHQVLSAKLSSGDWQGLNKPALPTIPDGLPEEWWPMMQSYIPLFTVFKRLRGKVVTGDTSTPSLFAFPPYDCVDICTYMGGSIPLAIGAHLAGYQDVWALTGDFSFIAAGHLGLPEALQRQINLKVLIFRNGKAQATGGQPIPGNLLEVILSWFRPFVKYIHNPRDVSEIESVLGEACSTEEMRIVVSDYRGA